MIRLRRPDDLEPCLALLREVHETDRYPAIWPPEPARWLAGRDCLAAWVDEAEGELRGHLSLHGTDPTRARAQWCEALGLAPAKLAVVSRFFVSPGLRERGIGSALMACAEGHAAAAGRRLALDVAEHNQAAIAFYERRGWRRVGAAELPLSADPWTLRVVLFVLG